MCVSGEGWGVGAVGGLCVGSNKHIGPKCNITPVIKKVDK